MGCCNDTRQFGYFYYCDKKEEGRDWVGGAVFQEQRAPPAAGRQQVGSSVSQVLPVGGWAFLYFFSFLLFTFLFSFTLAFLEYTLVTLFQSTGGRAKAVGGDRGLADSLPGRGSLYLLTFQVPNPGASHGHRQVNPKTVSFRASRGPGELPVAHAGCPGSQPSTGALAITCFSLLAFLPGSPASPPA